MTQATPHPLRDTIIRHNITRVAVVDDAFDPVSLDWFQEGEVVEFIDAVNEDDVLLQEFHHVAGNDTENNRVLSVADLTDEIATRLLQNRESLDGLKGVLSTTLFRVQDRKVTQVNALYKFLNEELGIATVRTFGTASEMPTEEFDLAFIDYRFGPSRDQGSVDRAVRWATHLYDKGRAFIILMSAEAEAKARQDVFRKDSKLTRGLFEFVAKEEIEDSGKFSNRLKSFCAGLGTRHEIHQFAVAAEAAAAESLDALKESIHSLGIEDYAYLEQISLREDGHPLGDYMLWLFGEYFAHKLSVNDSLHQARRSVNGLKYDQFLPLQRPPSVMLATMYSTAITEPVFEGWGAHPRDLTNDSITIDSASSPEGDVARETVEASAGECLQETEPLTTLAASATVADQADSSETQVPTVAPDVLPLYQLGDLLVATRDKPAYLVINAGCDLQFSPGTKRECDPEQSILLIPGRFELLHERGDETNMKRTELYELQGERFRVIWQHTRATAVPHRTVRKEFEAKGYQRKARLKLAYALEVQQHFAAQLTRVGVPTPTPVFREHAVELYGKGADNNFLKIGSIANGVVIFHYKDSDQFVLTVDCINEVLDLIDRYAAQVEGELSGDATGAAGDAVPVPKLTTKESPARLGESTGIAQGVRTNGDQAEAARTHARKRRKYIEQLREAREALALRCCFQESLSVIPAEGKSKQHIDVISKTDKRTRLEIRHTPSLKGMFQGNAPVVLAFAIPKAGGPELPEVIDTSLPEGIQHQHHAIISDGAQEAS